LFLMLLYVFLGDMCNTITECVNRPRVSACQGISQTGGNKTVVVTKTLHLRHSLQLRCGAYGSSKLGHRGAN